jgi:hypothetical protein
MQVPRFTAAKVLILLCAVQFALPLLAAEPKSEVTMVVSISEPHNPKKAKTTLEMKTGKKKGVRKHCRLEVDATQGYFVCDDPAFSMTLQENNSLLVGKKLYRIKSIKKK